MHGSLGFMVNNHPNIGMIICPPFSEVPYHHTYVNEIVYIHMLKQERIRTGG